MAAAKKSAQKKRSVYLERGHLEQPAPSAGCGFALTAGFQRIDSDARPISEIPEDELLHGFGE
jgi:hypothetical protein